MDKPFEVKEFDSIDFAELYENFLNVCEEVMRLGLK